MEVFRSTRRWATLAAVGTVAAGSVGVALADQLSVDNDIFSPGEQKAVSLSVASGGAVSTSAGLRLDWRGSKHIVSFDTVASSNLPAGATVAAPSFTAPGDWNDQGDVTSKTAAIAFTAPTVAVDTDLVYTVEWGYTNLVCDSGDDKCLHGQPKFTINLHVVAPTATANSAPTVATAATDASGIEGDTLTASGSFADADDDSLTLSANNSVGTFTDKGDGSWEWSLATTDDVPEGTVVVTADDGNGGTVTDDFKYAAANANPVLADPTLSSTYTVACLGGTPGTLSYSFSDAGINDNPWSALINGATTSLSSQGTQAVPVTLGVGSETRTVKITDKDGGASAQKTTNSLTLNYASAGVEQPINRDGSSTFKLGSTIPVKIKVLDCNGVIVDSLQPRVSLQRTSGTAATVDEPVSSAAADTGSTMRWDSVGSQYIFNLSTKRSQFAAPVGGDLTEGTYSLTISAPGLAETVVFQIKR